LVDILDDNNGGAPISMAYVDDVNCLIPLEDVYEFIEMFSSTGAKQGANLNTSKT